MKVKSVSVRERLYNLYKLSITRALTQSPDDIIVAVWSEPKMNVIWHADDLQELDWIRDLLGNVIEQEVIDTECARFDDYSIHVVNTNKVGLPKFESYFRECRSRCKHIVLYHVGDEHFSGGYKVYGYFDAVLRNYHTYLATSKGILTLPLGYPNGTITSRPKRPVNDRHHVWSFVGEIKTSRAVMAEALAGIGPNRLVSNKLSGTRMAKDDFDALLVDSVFSPCPMGNAVLETWRLYESLEAGCIPLTEMRRDLNYFESLFGPNPVPAFRSWNDAARFVRESSTDFNYIEQLQARISDWWEDYKTAARQSALAIITASHNQALCEYASTAPNQLALLYEPLRLAEILRHQNLRSLSRRLTRPLGPFQRMIGDILGSRESGC